jgi:hypothetical protein
MSPPILSDVLACDDTLDADAEKVLLDCVQMFPPTAIPSKVSTFKPLKLLSVYRLRAFVQWPFSRVEIIISTKEKKLVTISVAAYQATSWTDSQASGQVWIVLLCNLNGGFSLKHLGDPGIELLAEDALESACASGQGHTVRLGSSPISLDTLFSIALDDIVKFWSTLG